MNKLKVKLTPLNIVSAFCLVIAILLLIDRKGGRYPQVRDITALVAGLSFLTAVIAFISDQIFRRFIFDLKKLWVVEGVLVIFIIILIFIIKASIS